MKQQWKHPSSLTPNKANIKKSEGKQMIIFDYEETVYLHAVKAEMTVNGLYLQKLWRDVLCKLPYLKQSRFKLHHDTANTYIFSSSD